MESCRRLRELRISFQIQVNHQDDLTSQLLCSRHRGKNEFFCGRPHGGGGSGQSGRLWTGGGSKSLFFVDVINGRPPSICRALLLDIWEIPKAFAFNRPPAKLARLAVRFLCWVSGYPTDGVYAIKLFRDVPKFVFWALQTISRIQVYFYLWQMWWDFLTPSKAILYGRRGTSLPGNMPSFTPGEDRISSHL